MSEKEKSGHFFEIEEKKPTGRRVPVKREAIDNPESARAMQVLQLQIQVTNPDDGSITPLDIEKVSTYPGLDNKRYVKPFDSKEREPNSLFVVPVRQSFSVNIVVDPEKRSLVHFDEVNAPGSASKSLAAHLSEILGKENVMDLDGLSLDDPESLIRLVPKRLKSNVLTIAVTSRKEIMANTSRAKVGNVIIPKS